LRFVSEGGATDESVSHRKWIISTQKELTNPLIHAGLRSMIHFTGGVILQKERVNEELSTRDTGNGRTR
jgi:hypothetical protein